MSRKGFSKCEIDEAAKADVAVDDDQLDNPAHYMPGTAMEAEQRIKDLLEEARIMRENCDDKAAMEALGRALHTIQDKYSHRRSGNWATHIKGWLDSRRDVDLPENNWAAYKNACKATDDLIGQFLAP